MADTVRAASVESASVTENGEQAVVHLRFETSTTEHVLIESRWIDEGGRPMLWWASL